MTIGAVQQGEYCKTKSQPPPRCNPTRSVGMILADGSDYNAFPILSNLWQLLARSNARRSAAQRLRLMFQTLHFPDAVPTLFGDMVFLRELTEDDVPAWFERASDPESAV